MKRMFSFVLLFTLAGGSVLGQHEEAIEYGKTITQEDLQDYLTILASDAMEGRETGERGQKMAAAFIAYHFEEIGLEPVVKAGDGYSYFQKFALERSSPGEIYVNIGGTKLINGEDLLFWGRKNMASEEEIQAVFVGDGSTKAFGGFDLTGKAAIVFGVGKGFQEMRALTTRSTANKAELTFLVIAEDEESFQEILPRYSRFSGGSSLGFKSRPSNSGGTFLISKPIASKMLGVEVETLTKATKDFEKGNSKALQKVQPATVTYKSSRDVDTIWTENILGYLEGSDKKDELVIVTAHFDHIGKSGENINNGADDDGSGVVSVMEIAQAFVEAKKAGNGPRRSMLFMMVTGEEKGLLGSQYYVENPVFPLENTVVDLNIDMIGRHDPAHEEDLRFVYLVGSDKLSSELHELSEMTNSTFTNLSLDYAYNDEKHPQKIYYRSDHWNFAKNNIPIIFYFTGIHEDYHKPTDTVDKIEFDMLQVRTELVYYTAWMVANRDERLVVDVPQETELDSRD